MLFYSNVFSTSRSFLLPSEQSEQPAQVSSIGGLAEAAQLVSLPAAKWEGSRKRTAAHQGIT